MPGDRRNIYSDLEKKKITREHMEKIREKTLNKYGIDLEKDDVSEIVSKIVGVYLEDCYENVSYKKVRYQNINDEGLTLPDDINFEIPVVYEEAVNYEALDSLTKEINTRMPVLDELPENERKKILKERETWLLFNYCTREEPIDYENEFRVMTFEEWKGMVDFFVRVGEIFEVDYAAQCLFRLKYIIDAGEESDVETGILQNENIRNMVEGRVSNGHSPFIGVQDVAFLKKLENIFGKQKYIRVFDFGIFGYENKKLDENWQPNVNQDITRYSYKYIEDMYEELNDAELQNYYFLDVIMGVSLTNTIFSYIISGNYHIDNKEEGEDKNVIKNRDIFTPELFAIIKMIGRLECVYGRNYMAQFVFSFLYRHNFDSDSIHDISGYLKENIDKYNFLYNDLCDIYVWLLFYDIEDRLEEEKEEVIRELEERYKERIKGVITDRNIADMTIIKSDKKYTLKEPKNTRRADSAYAQIHMAVMKGIWKEHE